jgi:hypothetical protein
MMIAKRSRHAQSHLLPVAVVAMLTATLGHTQVAANSATTPPAATATTAPVAAAPAMRLFVVHLTTGSGWQKDRAVNEQEGFREHSTNLARLRSEGKLVIGARYQDKHADKGMLVLRVASRNEIETEFARDPMIASKHFDLDIAEFNPFYDGFVGRSARPTSTGASANPLSPFAWLVGCWEGRRGGLVTREHWMPDAGRLMLGMARTVREGRVINYETIRLEVDTDGSTPLYVPTPSGQKEARFRLTSQADSKWTFENPAHDYPQKITYERKADGSLLARIEGIDAKQSGKIKSIDFPMKRASCE